MKRKRHRLEQIIRKLREADWMLSEGWDIAAVCQQLGSPHASPRQRPITKYPLTERLGCD